MNAPLWLSVLRKELLDHSRDRRSMLTALLFPLLGPLISMGMFTALANWHRSDQTLAISTVGAENAPNLVAFLKRAGAEVTDAPEDYAAKVEAGELELALVIPKDYGKHFENGEPAPIELWVDNSRNSAQASIRRTERLLQAYAGFTGHQRLVARGVDPQLVSPIEVDEIDVATSAQRAATLLSIIPMFLLMAAFIGGMYLAIDATAGERERGSLEPLLLNPVPRAHIVLGKWAAAVLMTWISVLLTLIAFKAAMRVTPLEDLGIRAEFGAEKLLQMLISIWPLTLLATAAQILISTYARSFKEAQSYVQLLLLVPLLPSNLLMLSPLKPAEWMYSLPFLGNHLLVTAALRGEAIPMMGMALGWIGTVLLTAGCLLFTVRLLADERIVFGRT